MSELSEFQKEVGKWGDKTFNHKRGDNSGAIVCHLAKEVDELFGTDDPEEAADCFLLLLHHAHINGYDLLAAAKAKMVINRKRKWGKPDKNGVVEHIREAGHVKFEKGVAEVTMVVTAELKALVEVASNSLDKAKKSISMGCFPTFSGMEELEQALKPFTKEAM